MLSLKRELKIRLKGAKRVAILGIGSPLRGDDALGLVLIEELKALLRKVKLPMPLKLFSCGVTPENYTGEIKKFKPGHIIIVDALDMNKEAGSISIIDAKKESVNVSFSTHALPIRIFTDYLSHYLDCRIIFIGIQAKTVEFGAHLSYEANKSVKQVTRLIEGNLIN
jgi:hydrogenase 3 maturation protease